MLTDNHDLETNQYESKTECKRENERSSCSDSCLVEKRVNRECIESLSMICNYLSNCLIDLQSLCICLKSGDDNWLFVG